jgi:hypothetical protein
MLYSNDQRRRGTVEYIQVFPQQEFAMDEIEDKLLTFTKLKYGGLILMFDKWMAGEIPEPNAAELKLLADRMHTSVETLKTVRANHDR